MGVDVRGRSDRATARIGQIAESIEIAAPRNRSTDSVRSSSRRGTNTSNEHYRIIGETASEGIWTIDEASLTTLVTPLFDKKAIGEGVRDAVTLKKRGMDFAKGFYLGRPKLLSPASIGNSQTQEACQQSDGTVGARK